MASPSKPLREAPAPKLGRLDALLGGHLHRTVCSIDLWVTMFLSLAVSALGDEKALRTAGPVLGAAQMQVGTALMGVVLAALAVLVVFLDEDYLALLEKHAPGLVADLAPFMYTAVAGAICAALGVGLILVGSPENANSLRAMLFLSLWSFLYLLWIMVDLVALVTKHARNRAFQLRNHLKTGSGRRPPAPPAPPSDISRN